VRERGTEREREKIEREREREPFRGSCERQRSHSIHSMQIGKEHFSNRLRTEPHLPSKQTAHSYKKKEKSFTSE
jgi:hypothetical protein